MLDFIKALFNISLFSHFPHGNCWSVV